MVEGDRSRQAGGGVGGGRYVVVGYSIKERRAALSGSLLPQAGSRCAGGSIRIRRVSVGGYPRADGDGTIVTSTDGIEFNLLASVGEV